RAACRAQRLSVRDRTGIVALRCADYGRVMRNKLWSGILGGVLGGALIAGAMGGTSCDNDNDNNANAAAGHGGSAFAGNSGSGGVGGLGIDGGTNISAFSVQLDGMNVVPSNTSTGTGTVVVTLNKTTGAVNVAGSFMGLSSNALSAA